MVIGLTIYIIKPDLFKSSEIAAEDWVPKDVEAEIEGGTLPEDVLYGYQLLTENQKYLGPQSTDPEMRFSGNNRHSALSDW